MLTYPLSHIPYLLWNNIFISMGIFSFSLGSKMLTYPLLSNMNMRRGEERKEGAAASSLYLFDPSR